MKKLLLLFTLSIVVTTASFAQWTTLATDATGDGSKGGSTYLDGTKLEYMYDNMSDSIWFRVTVASALSTDYGINILLNVNGAGSTMKWFGTNAAFGYNRVVTAWISSSSSMSVVGISDATGFNAGNYTSLGSNNIDVSMDMSAKTYTLGMKRTDIFNDTVLNAEVIAGVGSNQFWDDDVPNSGSGMVQAKPASLSVSNINTQGRYKIYPNPSQGLINITGYNPDNNAEISVYSTTGRQVYNEFIPNNSTTHTIDVNSQPAGLYFIKVETAESSYVQSVMLK